MNETDHAGGVESASRSSHHGRYGDRWRAYCTCGWRHITKDRSEAERAFAAHFELVYPDWPRNANARWRKSTTAPK